MALFFQFETGEGPGSLEIIPDNCINFFFCREDVPSALVSGFGLKREIRQLEPNALYFGVKPYTVQGVRQHRIGWGETVGEMTDFFEMFGRQAVVEQICLAENFEKRISLFQDFAKTHLINENYCPDLVEYSELMMCSARGNLKIEELSRKLGYTSRHCREHFKNAHGISIKCYSEILRFQNAVRMMEENSCSIADIVFENNYYDQSHLIREFKRFTDFTPVDFRKRYMQRDS
jgi:AraC-like DNA-binding protein